jgi:hypothetical protein
VDHLWDFYHYNQWHDSRNSLVFWLGSGGPMVRLRGEHTSPTLIGRTVLLFILVLASTTGSAQADAEFATRGERWNGLGRFLAIADEESVPMFVTTNLDSHALDPSEAVVLLHVQPSRSLARLSSFVERGGALVIADESDAVDALLERLAFVRFDDAGADAASVPDREGLFVAAPLLQHPLVEGVDWLVANVPRPFKHESLAPVVALDEERHLVAIGKLGRGELVALGDSSLFIDQMLELRGNERFARNMLRMLRDRSRVHVVVGPGRVFGAPPGSSSRSGVVEVREALSRVASIPTSPSALHFASVIALAGLVIFLASRLVRSHAFQGPRTLVLQGEEGGVPGRVSFHRTHSTNLRSPTLVYRRTLYEALSTMLHAEVNTPELAASGLRARGIEEALAGEARSILARLDEIHGGRAGGVGLKVSSRVYRGLVARGERLLTSVEAALEAA